MYVCMKDCSIFAEETGSSQLCLHVRDKSGKYGRQFFIEMKYVSIPTGNEIISSMRCILGNTHYLFCFWHLKKKIIEKNPSCFIVKRIINLSSQCSRLIKDSGRRRCVKLVKMHRNEVEMHR